MRIRAERTLREYEARYPNAKPQLLAWRADTLAAEWKSPTDVKARYANASIIDNQLVVFNLAGNSYRLISRFITGQKLFTSVGLARTPSMIRLTLIKFEMR